VQRCTYQGALISERANTGYSEPRTLLKVFSVSAFQTEGGATKVTSSVASKLQRHMAIAKRVSSHTASTVRRARPKACAKLSKETQQEYSALKIILVLGCRDTPRASACWYLQ
jgi:hypothetical protein